MELSCLEYVTADRRLGILPGIIGGGGSAGRHICILRSAVAIGGIRSGTSTRNAACRGAGRRGATRFGTAIGLGAAVRDRGRGILHALVGLGVLVRRGATVQEKSQKQD